MSKTNKNTGTSWSAGAKTSLSQLARQNTPTRVIGLKLGRTPAAVQSMAQRLNVSLKPVNQSPYTKRKS